LTKKRMDRVPKGRVLTREDLQAALEDSDLTAEEEKVLRMRYGLPVRASDSLRPQSDDPATQAQLQEMEAQLLRAMQEAGHITRKDLMIAQFKARQG